MSDETMRKFKFKTRTFTTSIQFIINAFEMEEGAIRTKHKLMSSSVSSTYDRLDGVIINDVMRLAEHLKV